MTTRRLHFPHISRIFSAFCLWCLLLALISYNIFLVVTNPLAYSDKVFQIFTHPFSALTHEDLAQTLLDSGNRTLATHELTLVAELSPVLGASTTAKTAAKAAEMIYWQHVTVAHPDYRDAYVQLASLSYTEGNLIQTHAYLLKAQTLDPNNATIVRLVDFTSKFLE